MELQLAETIVRVAAKNGIYASLHKEYVGRYSSKPTAAVSGISMCNMLRIVINSADEFVGDAGGSLFFIGCLSQDFLGTSEVIY